MFWSCVPEKVTEWQQQLAVMTNKLHEFLDMDDDDRRVVIRRVPGRVTLVKRFKEGFSACMGQSLEELDPVVLAQFGFRLSEGRVMVCRACQQLAKGRDGRCCEEYSKVNRSSADVIYDMEMEG